ncbi:hypothetical protein BGZ94_004857, partial [Podila epigama]
YVWELDGFRSTGPLNIGFDQGDWTSVALQRLKMWCNTPGSKQSPTDIQAIIKI